MEELVTSLESEVLIDWSTLLSKKDHSVYPNQHPELKIVSLAGAWKTLGSNYPGKV